MFFYFVLLLIIYLIGVIGAVTNHNKACLRINLVLLCVVLSIRDYSVGADVSIYHNLFYQIGNATDWLTIINIVSNAPIYSFLNKLISYLGGFRLLLIFEAVTLCIAVDKYTRDFSKNYILTIYCFISLFFYMHAFNLSRQFFSISFVLFAICFRRNSKKISSLIFFLLAIGVHSIALIALPLLVLKPEEVTSRIFKFSIIFAAAGGLGIKFFLVPLINIFVSIFPRYSIYLGSFAVHNVFKETSSGANFWLNLFYLLVAIFAITVQSNIFSDIHVPEEDAGLFRYLTFAVFMGAVLGIAGGNNMAISRAIYFYQIHAIALIPNCLNLFKRYRVYWLFAYFLLLILIIPMAICLQKNMGEVIPYQTIWS